MFDAQLGETTELDVVQGHVGIPASGVEVLKLPDRFQHRELGEQHELRRVRRWYASHNPAHAAANAAGSCGSSQTVTRMGSPPGRYQIRTRAPARGTAAVQGPHRRPRTTHRGSALRPSGTSQARGRSRAAPAGSVSFTFAPKDCAKAMKNSRSERRT